MCVKNNEPKAKQSRKKIRMLQKLHKTAQRRARKSARRTTDRATPINHQPSTVQHNNDNKSPNIQDREAPNKYNKTSVGSSAKQSSDLRE
jgi:hypothetical protein